MKIAIKNLFLSCFFLVSSGFILCSKVEIKKEMPWLLDKLPEKIRQTKNDIESLKKIINNKEQLLIKLETIVADPNCVHPGDPNKNYSYYKKLQAAEILEYKQAKKNLLWLTITLEECINSQEIFLNLEKLVSKKKGIQNVIDHHKNSIRLYQNAIHIMNEQLKLLDTMNPNSSDPSSLAEIIAAKEQRIKRISLLQDAIHTDINKLQPQLECTQYAVAQEQRSVIKQKQLQQQEKDRKEQEAKNDEKRKRKELALLKVKEQDKQAQAILAAKPPVTENPVKDLLLDTKISQERLLQQRALDEKAAKELNTQAAQDKQLRKQQAILIAAAHPHMTTFPTELPTHKPEPCVPVANIYNIRLHGNFAHWISTLSEQTQAIINERIDRIKNGDFGDAHKLHNTGSLWELRIKRNKQSYRVYYTLEGSHITVLYGGTKNTQEQDIEIVKKYVKDLQ